MSGGVETVITILGGEQTQFVCKSIIERRLDGAVSELAEVELVLSHARCQQRAQFGNEFNLRFTAYATAAYADKRLASLNRRHEFEIGLAAFNKDLRARFLGIQVFHHPYSVGSFQR